MPLRAPLPDITVLEFEASNEFERHITRLHARTIDSTALAPLNDYAYLTPNTDVGAEVSVIETCDGFAVNWAPYYPPPWALALRAVYTLVGDLYTELLPMPAWAGALGSSVDLQPPGTATTLRIFHLRSTALVRRRLWIRQLTAGDVGPAVAVRSTGGGYELRDHHLMAYLSGDVTAVLAPDGLPFLTEGTVSSWFDRPIQITPP